MVVYTLYRDRLALTVDGRTVVDTAGGKVDFGSRYHDLEYSVPSAFTIRSGPEAAFRVSRLELTPRGWQPLVIPEPACGGRARKAIESLIPPANEAEQLWHQAAKNPADTARRYVLLEAATRLAGEAGDLPLICRLAIELDRTFAGDHRDVYGPAIAEAFKSAHRPRPAGADRRSAAADRGRDVGRRFRSGLGVSNGRGAVKPLPVELGKELKASGTELTFAKAEKEAADKALASLASSPASAPACTMQSAGTCAVRGLADAAKELSQGDDTALTAAVKAEMIGSRVADDQFASGEKWWAIADKATGPLKWARQERAAVWYNRGRHGQRQDRQADRPACEDAADRTEAVELCLCSASSAGRNQDRRSLVQVLSHDDALADGRGDLRKRRRQLADPANASR